MKKIAALVLMLACSIASATGYQGNSNSVTPPTQEYVNKQSKCNAVQSNITIAAMHRELRPELTEVQANAYFYTTMKNQGGMNERDEAEVMSLIQMLNAYVYKFDLSVKSPFSLGVDAYNLCME